MKGPATRAIRVGARGSRLAQVQAALVIESLSTRHPGLGFDVVNVTTAGDLDARSPAHALGVGVFVTALEAALRNGRIDLAVHSLKDMPATDEADMTIAAVPVREHAQDALVNRWGASLADLPSGARIGTGSPRRRAQLLAVRPDLNVSPMRGNVDTRTSKALAGKEFDGAVLATAGLARLGLLEEAAEILDLERFVPAVGQGALAVEARADDQRSIDLASAIDNLDVRAAVTAERAFLAGIGGGCAMPVGAYARCGGGRLVLRAFVSDLDGVTVIRRELTGEIAEAADAGGRLARVVLDAGAAALMTVSQAPRPARQAGR